MRRIRKILIASAVACAVALALAWLAVSDYADRHTRKMLGRSSEVFVQMIENALDATLWYAGSLAAYYLDYSTAPRTVKEMQDLADLLYVDEITVVGTNGIAVASNYGEFVGFDWHKTPETSAYLELFEPDSKAQKLMQKFRPCVLQHDHYRKFGAVVFTNRLGFVQVGYAMDRLVETMAWTEADAFSRWRFGRHGRFGAVDRDGDEVPDLAVAGFAGTNLAERVERIETDGGDWHRLTFPFAGRLFYAEVPDREFGDQRNAAFLIAAILIVSLMSLFTAMLIRLRLSSEKVEKLHREAERRVAADLKLAHTIQMSTLPHVATFNREYGPDALEAVMIPAREVGGDFYDFFTLADGRVAFIIGDVSGKGVPAAMFMLVAKSAIRQALRGESDPARAMAAANATLCADNEAEMFVTMVLCVFDPKSGEVIYVNAGHNRPFVVRTNGTVERLEVRGGRLLGLFANISYRAASVSLAAGDRLFLYTDGVTEAQDVAGRLYGEPRLRTLLSTRPAGICSAVRADVAEHVAGIPASDDLTMLTLAVV